MTVENFSAGSRVDRLSRLAHHAASLKRGDIPDDVVERSKLMVLDLLGVTISGSNERRIQRMMDAIRKRGSNGRSVVVGAGGTGDAADAAMINATSGCIHVLEDGHKFARGHLSNNIVPALLAVAEEQGASGLEFLVSFVAAYEIAVRVTLACTIRHQMHSSGTTATIGAAAGCARLMGFDADAIRETMNVAAPLTLATSWNAAEDGATVRDLYAGKGNSNAVWAPRWVLSGFSGADDDVSHVFGCVTSDHFDSAILDAGLGTEWEMRRSYFKRHSCCRTIQSAVDAALDIKERHAFDPNQIERVIVDTFQMPVTRNSRREARNAIAAKESEPITLALVLAHGHCNEDLHTPERVFSEETKCLVSKIVINVDADLEALFPDQHPARVHVALKDGREFESYSSLPLGDPSNPLSVENIEEKYFRLTRGLGSARAAALREAVDNLDSLPSASELTAHLAGPVVRQPAVTA